MYNALLAPCSTLLMPKTKKLKDQQEVTEVGRYCCLHEKRKLKLQRLLFQEWHRQWSGSGSWSRAGAVDFCLHVLLLFFTSSLSSFLIYHNRSREHKQNNM